MNTKTEVCVRRARDMKAPWAPQATNTVKNRGSRLSKTIWRGRQWAATAYGVEQRNGTYQIQRTRLWKDDDTWSWVQHMAEKGWCDLADFTEALRIARITHSTAHERKYWHGRASDPIEEPPCDLDPAHIDALDEISGYEQLCLIFCNTHRAWEWKWVDRRWAGIER
jgi:hypothetical protein